ncbi:hypothetical protein CEP53_013976 [Fusarium sp. AF-6]|nr:hypothetical protein CEP53_013976 [Fusarium sp. AF-6]
MTPSIFHPFSRLPTELRLQIWENACLPSQQQSCGLHYFTLNDDKKLVSSGWNRITSSELQALASQANRSAYLWHGGLWTACKESRAVVMKHSRLKEWEDLLERAQREDKRAESHERETGRARTPPLRMHTMSDWVVGDEGAPPGMIVMREGHEEWYFIVYPTRDIFCVTAENWESVLQSRPYWDDYHYLPVPGYDLFSLHVENIAFEFDPSWNHALPDDIFDLMMENSARGLLARMVEEMVSLYALRFNIWLVDKTARWLAQPDQFVGPVFHDCDDEYVQIGFYDTEYNPDKEPDGSPITYFIRKFGCLGDFYYRDIERGPRSPGLDYVLDGPNFWAESSIRLLVRRDNQVVEEEEHSWIDSEDEA